MTDFFIKEDLEIIGKTLLKNKQTVAMAESVTSGLLQAAFSTIPDASLFFQGGITAYNLDQKSRHLHIDEKHAKACNCVSGRVAFEMAHEVCRLFSCDWGIGITGYATKVPESGNRLFAFYSIAKDGKCMAEDELQPPGEEEPFRIQQWYTNQLITVFTSVLKTQSNAG